MGSCCKKIKTNSIFWYVWCCIPLNHSTQKAETRGLRDQGQYSGEVHTFNPSSQEAKAVKPLSSGQPGLPIEFQDSQDYTGKPCLKQTSLMYTRIYLKLIWVTGGRWEYKRDGEAKCWSCWIHYSILYVYKISIKALEIILRILNIVSACLSAGSSLPCWCTYSTTSMWRFQDHP